GPGDASHELRRYAALHGIVLIDRGNWPAPFLVARTSQLVTDAPLQDPTSILSNLFRPMQRALHRAPGGGYHVAPLSSSLGTDQLVSAHDRWSDWFWSQIDSSPGTFEEILWRRLARIRGAA